MAREAKKDPSELTVEEKLKALYQLQLSLIHIYRTIFHGGNIDDKWFWLLPLLLLIYIGVVYTLRRVFRSWLNQEGSILGLINSNLAILTLLCLMTVGIGNTNVNFHHELAVEQAIRNHHYEAARKMCIRDSIWPVLFRKSDW